jgi:hypothetical protein
MLNFSGRDPTGFQVSPPSVVSTIPFTPAAAKCF